MRVLRGVEDQKAFDASMNNTTDRSGPGDAALETWRGERSAAGRSRDGRGLETADVQRRHPRWPASRHRRRAQDGHHHEIHHDAAIVYGTRPYVLVVLVEALTIRRRAPS